MSNFLWFSVCFSRQMVVFGASLYFSQCLALVRVVFLHVLRHFVVACVILGVFDTFGVFVIIFFVFYVSQRICHRFFSYRSLLYFFDLVSYLVWFSLWFWRWWVVFGFFVYFFRCLA